MRLVLHRSHTWQTTKCGLISIVGVRVVDFWRHVTCRSCWASQDAPTRRHRAAALLLLSLLSASVASAQALPKVPEKVDLPPVAWAPEHQRAAEIWSNLTLGANVVLETYDAWQAPNRKHALIAEAERIAVVEVGTDLVKIWVHRTRPCAPDCGISNPNKSFPSGHASLAFTATGARLKFTLPLASATAYFRMAANLHWFSDVWAGAILGALSTLIR